MALAYSPVGVLLAAGLGTRMGGKTFKLCQPLAGRPLVSYAASALAGAGYGSLVAVVPAGEGGERLREALQSWPFQFVVQPEPQRGLITSFQCAVRELGEAEAAVFALADMPLVSVATHLALLEWWQTERPPAILTEYAGEERVTAPPTLLRSDLFAPLLSLPPADEGLRSLLRDLGGQVRRLPRPADELLDVDTPQALAEAHRRILAK